MNDLLEYLKAPYVLGERHASPGELVDQMLSKMKEAADHIEAQAKIIDELSEALRPFALVEIWDISASEHDLDLYKPMPEQYAAGGVLRVRDFRKASEVWAKVPDRFLPKSNPNTPDRNDK